MKRSIWILLALVLITFGFGVKQTRTITGKVTDALDGGGIAGINILLKGASTGTTTDAEGNYQINVPTSGATLVFSFVGYETKEIKIGTSNVIDVVLSPDVKALEEVVVTGYSRSSRKDAGAPVSKSYSMQYEAEQDYQRPQWNTEEYDGIEENIFREALKHPLSTFSIDVDAASYSNVRRFINNGRNSRR